MKLLIVGYGKMGRLIDQMAHRYEEATAADPSVLSSVALPQAPSP